MADQRIHEIAELEDASKTTAVLPVVHVDSADGDWRKVRLSDLLNENVDVDVPAPSSLALDNFPATDPADGTLLFFNADQSSFTSGKTVRNDADGADVASANQRDLFKYFADGTKWIRQYIGAAAADGSTMPSAFDFTMERGFTVYPGETSSTGTIGWTQGNPVIESFDVDDITIMFFGDFDLTDPIGTGDERYSIGDETLAEIITLENFVDNDDNTGTVDIRVDPSGITAEELMTSKSVYVTLQVTQPS